MKKHYNVALYNIVFEFDNYNDASAFMDLAIDGGAPVDVVDISIYYIEGSEDDETES